MRISMSLGSKIGMLLALGLALNACSSTDDGKNKTGLFKPVYSEDHKFIDPNEYCPKAVLRGGTENYRTFPRGQKDNLARLQMQATILKVARECVYENNQLQLKVGVAGRYIPGPQRAGGTFSMPIRIAVRRGNDTIYSKLHRIPANLNQGQIFGKFQFVDDTIFIDVPQQRNIQIFVGYDEGSNK